MGTGARTETIQARRFLTRDTIDLRMICDFAGVDPEFLMSQTRTRWPAVAPIVQGAAPRTARAEAVNRLQALRMRLQGRIAA
ncbi:MAG: hypothetical protein ABJX32_20445 [Tateyamaria sp.]|uniref:hypothetical protein n=1 Tax=Tateyamaria sp. TaxID=1929288 RepID=UPI00329F7953